MKIRAQVMLENDIFTTMVALQQKYKVRNLSVIINKVLREAFTYQKQIERLEKTIEHLQNTITEVGTRAENYRNQLLKEEKNDKPRSKQKK